MKFLCVMYTPGTSPTPLRDKVLGTQIVSKNLAAYARGG